MVLKDLCFSKAKEAVESKHNWTKTGASAGAGAFVGAVGSIYYKKNDLKKFSDLQDKLDRTKAETEEMEILRSRIKKRMAISMAGGAVAGAGLDYLHQRKAKK